MFHSGIITMIDRYSYCFYLTSVLQSFQTPYHNGKLAEKPIDYIAIILVAMTTNICKVEEVVRGAWKKAHADGDEKMTGTNSIKHKAPSNSGLWSAAAAPPPSQCHLHLTLEPRATCAWNGSRWCSGQQLNGYLCRSALWSLLMTSRWSSSIFKTLFVHKGSWGNEVLVIGINEISPCRLIGVMQREEVSLTPPPTVFGETLRMPHEQR